MDVSMVNNYVMQIMHTLFSEIKGDFTWEELNHQIKSLQTAEGEG